MIKLIDLLKELSFGSHYTSRKENRVMGIKKVIVSKEALGDFTLNQIQEPLIKEIQNIVLTKLKGIEAQDVPASKSSIIGYKFLIPVLEVNGKKYPITIVSDKGTGTYYYVIIYQNFIRTIVLSTSEDFTQDVIKHSERKETDKNIPIHIFEPEGAKYSINLNRLMGIKTETKKVLEKDLPYKVRTDYRIGANFEHNTYGTGKIVATSSGNTGKANQRGMLDWIEVNFGKPHFSGGKLQNTRKITGVYAKPYFEYQNI